MVSVQSPHDWYLSNTRKVDYILVLVTNGKVGDRFIRGPWKKFLEILGKDEKIQLIHYTEDDFEDLPSEFVDRWYSFQWSGPYIALFTKESWDREEDLQGRVFHGIVDDHWLIDHVVSLDPNSKDRYDEKDLHLWYLSILSPRESKKKDPIANLSYFKV